MKLRRILRATRDVFTRGDERGLSLWTVLGGLLLSALVTAFFVIPNLLGARNSTLNAAAEHNLEAALTAGKTYFAQGDTYAGLSPAALQADEPTLTFVGGTTASTSPKDISAGASPTSLIMAAKSTGTGGCYFVWDNEFGSGAGTYYANSPSGTCDVSSRPTNLVWSPNGWAG